MSRIIRLGTPNVSGFSTQKHDISDNVYEYFDFPIVGENISGSRTANSQLLTRRNRKERGEMRRIVIAESGNRQRKMRNQYAKKNK